jgi:hypothetical protein
MQERNKLRVFTSAGSVMPVCVHATFEYPDVCLQYGSLAWDLETGSLHTYVG